MDLFLIFVVRIWQIFKKKSKGYEIDERQSGKQDILWAAHLGISEQ